MKLKLSAIAPLAVTTPAPAHAATLTDAEATFLDQLVTGDTVLVQRCTGDEANGAGSVPLGTRYLGSPAVVMAMIAAFDAKVIIPLTSANTPYDTARDFQAIYRLITSALAFVVPSSPPVDSLQELIAYAKANPGKLSYGTPGVGTGNHLVGEMFKRQSGAMDIVHIPYRGMGPATNDLIGGQITMMIAVMSGQLLQLHYAGKLRILAVTSETRLGGARDIPTAIESGMPNLRYAGWFGLFAPKATPDGIIERIASATAIAMADTVLRENYRSQAMEPDINSSPGRFQRLVEDELKDLAPLIRSIGLKRD